MYYYHTNDEIDEIGEGIIRKYNYQAFIQGDPTDIEGFIADHLNYRIVYDSLTQIAKYLTESPYKTYRGHDFWKKEEVRYILTNEKYVGDIILQKTFISNCIDKQIKLNRGELPKYLVSNNHPGIIDRDTFNVVQVEFANRSNKKSKSNLAQTEKGRYSSKFALTDILICGCCGSHYRRTGKTDKNGSIVL